MSVATGEPDATPGWGPRGAPSHGHLWSLPDGTGLHAPPGQLPVEAGTGRLCCHLCGRWFVSLGSHVRTHGHTAESYREAIGLCRTRPLVAAALSRSIASRQARAYHRSAQVRARFAPSQELRRSGELTGLARTTLETTTSLERTRIRRAALEAGRASRRAQRDEALCRWLGELGYDTLADYLSAAYRAGASLDGLARATGLGRTRLRQEIEVAGIVLRTAGRNTDAGRRSRARTADAAAARRVGTDDLRRWLRAHRAAGCSVRQLAIAVGHSTHWVRWRLQDDVPACPADRVVAGEQDGSGGCDDPPRAQPG